MNGEGAGTSSNWWDALRGDTVSDNREARGSEPVWTYRGYRLKASEFNTAMVHFFRSQVQRADVWRRRLDATTNWAVITTGATISLAFTRGLGSHSVILLDTLLVTLFSLVLCILGWPDAQFGVYIDLIILAYLLIGGQFGWLP